MDGHICKLSRESTQISSCALKSPWTPSMGAFLHLDKELNRAFYSEDLFGGDA